MFSHRGRTKVVLASLCPPTWRLETTKIVVHESPPKVLQAMEIIQLGSQTDLEFHPGQLDRQFVGPVWQSKI